MADGKLCVAISLRVFALLCETSQSASKSIVGSLKDKEWEKGIVFFIQCEFWAPDAD